jgi:hypothetical protein
MRNITVSIGDETYIQARVWAAQRDTSLSAVVQYLFETLPSVTRAVRAFSVHEPKTGTAGHIADISDRAHLPRLKKDLQFKAWSIDSS